MCKLKLKNDNKQRFELQDIFNKYADQYKLNNNLTSEQKRAITDITSCRTSRLGYNAKQCCSCKNIEFSYNSCRNRNCPKCQGNKRHEWIQQRMKTTLDVPYYHTVFTVPNQLFDIAIFNQKLFYDLLFRCASNTLKLFAQNTKYWDLKDTHYNENNKPNIKLSFFGILHTWGQTLVYHPHIHFIVAGAGIINNEIVEPKYNSKFLFPVKAMSKVFRGKLIQSIKKAYYSNKLQLDNRFDDTKFFESFINNIVNRKWVVYSKSQFQSSAKIVEYMSRYTHRTAISNSRIISINNNKIRFKYKDYKDNSKQKIMKLSSDEFIKRFLYHILPKRYYRIRYYGVIQKLSTIKNKKIIIQNHTKEDINEHNSKTLPTKPKCKKCKCKTSEVIVVVNGYNKVVQGLMTPIILNLRKEIEFNDTT